MKVSSNNISDIKAFMQSCLQELYPAEEINSMFYILMETYCGMSRVQIHSGLRETINESELLLVYDAIKELGIGKPIQYITGKAWFCGIEIKVNEDVLIPRPETEELVQLIIRENKNRKGLKILDIGTGSGCIAIALKKSFNDAEVMAIDKYENTIQVTYVNNWYTRASIRIRKMDILDMEKIVDLPPAFDIIVSNPPYVMESEKPLMHKNVLEHEPHNALFVKDDNALQYYEAILRYIKNMDNKCKVYLEINENKAQDMIFLAKTFGFMDICIHKDINRKDRFFIINGE
jgi:release factor glutamine methyltransferase